jgi:hypothetical protein
LTNQSVCDILVLQEKKKRSIAMYNEFLGRNVQHLQFGENGQLECVSKGILTQLRYEWCPKSGIWTWATINGKEAIVGILEYARD